MANAVLFLCHFLVILTIARARQHEEPVCTSRFDYEEKLLQKMVRLEHKMELLQDIVNKRLTEIGQEKNNILLETKDLIDKVRTEKDGALENLEDTKVKIEESLENFMDEKEVVINAKISEINESLNKQGPAIVFSITDAQSSLVNGAVIFNRVLTNEGSAFDVNTGVFTAPYDGVYVFSFNVRSQNSGYCFCYILKNLSTQGYAISDGPNDMGSVNVNLQLGVGDKVTLGSCGHFSNVDPSGTAFSGHIVTRL